MSSNQTRIGVATFAVAARYVRLRPLLAVVSGLAAFAALAAWAVAAGRPHVWAPPLDLVAAVVALAVFASALWRGISAVLAAPVLAAALALLAADAPVAFLEETFAGGAGGFIARFLVVFLLGAILGSVMKETGCAAGLAAGLRRLFPPAQAPLAVVAICALLTLGGVGVFVIAFSVYPIARDLFARAGLPNHQIPAAIALGTFTATMTAVPGAPSFTNVVASAFLGTTAFAAPLAGLVATATMLAFGCAFIAIVAARTPRKPRPPEEAPAGGPGPIVSALPLLVALVANAGLTALLVSLDDGDGRFGTMGPGYWAVAGALALAIATAALVGRRGGLVASLDRGATAAVGPLVGTAACIGFGASLAALPGVAAAVEGLRLRIGPDSPLSVAAATAFTSAAAGSSSGGLTIALSQYGEAFLADGGLAPEIVHRFAALGSGTLDTLPHSAAVVALLAICGSTHRSAYRDIFAVTVAGPVLALGAAAAVLAIV